MKKIFRFLSLGLFLACSQPTEKSAINSTDEEKLEFSAISTTNFPIREVIYVPAYSEISAQYGKSKLSFTVSLSVRNTSRKDTIYIDRVEYYDAMGNLIKTYLEKTILLQPLQSASFLVEQKDNIAGEGGNFLVYYASAVVNNVPEAQAVMISSSGHEDVSLITRGKVIDRYYYKKH